MHIQFCGAAGTTTGSKHILHIGGKKVMLDCGLFQGHRKEAYERNMEFPFKPSEIDYLILSHAHIDHSGLIPALVRDGFTGPIYCTSATRDLCSVMLQDSAYIQEKDAEYINERAAKKGLPEIEPIYTVQDAINCMENFKTISYNRCEEIDEDITICFHDAGHILGAAITTITSKSEGKKIVFTGDLGRKGLPILRDPVVVPEADVYITEGTYGNRSHDDTSKMEESVAEVFNKTLKRGGKIIVPAFSVERTQELVYIIHKLLEQGKIPKVPMFVDSPLSTNVTQIFKMHPECYDEDTYHEFIVNQQNPFGFNSLKYITKVEDSKALNEFEGSCVIIAASGMCENGRIVHHLRAHIENPSNTIMIIGYQAEGTLGRKLVEQEKEVTILGESYTVNAEIRILNAFSAHADEEELVSYASQIKGIKQVFVVHGEQASLENLAIRLREALKLSDDAVVIPELFKTYEVRA